VNASHSCPNAHLIRVHSWFKNTTPFVSIRGSKTPLHSYPFVVQKTPLHSCQSVVQKQPSIRVHSWFKTPLHSCQFVVQNTPPFVSIRGSKNTTPFVSIRGSKQPSIHVHSWFKTAEPRGRARFPLHLKYTKSSPRPRNRCSPRWARASAKPHSTVGPHCKYSFSTSGSAILARCGPLHTDNEPARSTDHHSVS